MALVAEKAERNIEILGGTELGQRLEPAYVAAVELDPRLAEAEIVPLSVNDHAMGGAVPSWHVSNGDRHQLQLSLDKPQQTYAKMDEFLRSVPGARKLFADILGIFPEALTPDLFHMFTMSHELGHIGDFIDNEDDPEAFDERIAEELASLPVPNIPVSAMRMPGSKANRHVHRHWAAISRDLEVDTLPELFEKQHTAYRNTPSERLADGFAAAVFRHAPHLFDGSSEPAIQLRS